MDQTLSSLQGWNNSWKLDILFSVLATKELTFQGDKIQGWQEEKE